MKTIAFISQKGGSGKTTLAVHLAVLATMKKKAVVLLDLDPQGSAMVWKDLRNIESELAAAQTTAGRLPELLEKAEKAGADLVIIDTAGHTDKDAITAANAADFVLVPCRPEVFDLRAISTTFKLLKMTKTHAAVVLNGCPRGRSTSEARDGLRGQGYPVLDVAINERVAFRHAIREGKAVHEYDPESTAAQDLNAFYEAINKQVKI